ncbi:MAG: hypothetical protein C5B58_06705 [Acidobacteria bacterium]|nr:MAG: hypothetical protein C5B58_06705 [Acidobacteriota bacterium]
MDSKACFPYKRIETPGLKVLFQKMQQSETASRSLQWDWAAFNPLSDIRVRYGIKVGLASILALWTAEALRLEHPNWSVLACLVLANTHYVGAIATKAAMRSIGTIVGVLFGIWIVGDFANAPLIFSFWTFLVVAIAAYKFGQVASAVWPYAYYMVGLGLVAVATYGITDPGSAWHIALYRALETLIGVIAATFVYAILWPRYAREEFVANAAEALKTIRLLLQSEAYAYAGEVVDPGRVTDLRLVFSGQLNGLRGLLVTGSRGSSLFRARLGNYQRFLTAIMHLFQAFLELQRRRCDEVSILELVRPELTRLLQTIDEDLSVLSKVALQSQALASSDLNAAFEALEKRVAELRDQGIFRNAALEAGESFFGHFAALRLIRDELNLVRELSGELPRVWVALPSNRKRRLHLPVIDSFWAMSGIKAGITVCLAFLIIKWIHPPGSAGIPLAAWIFSVLGRSSLNTGGTGDLRSFQKVFLTFVFGLPVVAGLWLIMPLLSNYWAMNIFLFLVCYIYGFAACRVQGVSFGMLIGILSIVAFVALNPQEPVSFSSLIDSFLGQMTGISLGALVGRLLWPVLPQGILRRNLILFFKDLRGMLGCSSDEEFILTNTALLPLEAFRAVEKMILPRCPPGEREALADFIRVVQPLGMQITCLNKFKTRPLPDIVEARLREPLTQLESEFDRFLANLSQRFHNPAAKIDFPDLQATFERVQTAIARIRDEGILASAEVVALAQMLEMADRYRTIVERLQSCRDRAAELRLDCYLGDVAL